MTVVCRLICCDDLNWLSCEVGGEAKVGECGPYCPPQLDQALALL